MVSREDFVATPFHEETESRIERLDKLLPSDAFTTDVRRSLYRYALIRNSWGTTNIDAGPIELARVEALYEAYERGAAGATKILPTEREVINYFRLVEDLPTSDFDASAEDVRLLHQEYFREVPLQNEARPGRWKERDNVVATPWRTLETSPRERAEEDLESLLSWYNRTRGKLPLVARAAIFFHGFQRIHPFGDGNGRVGRLAALFLLSAGGLEGIRYAPVDDAINEDRQEYYLALARGDAGDLEYWVGYFGAQLHHGYQRAHLLAQRLQRIPPKVPASSRRLLEHAYVHRVDRFRLGDVRDVFLDDSRRPVIRRLAELEDLGFLRREGVGAGSRYVVVPLRETTAKGPQNE
jgi:Fic family protein